MKIVLVFLLSLAVALAQQASKPGVREHSRVNDRYREYWNLAVFNDGHGDWIEFTHSIWNVKEKKSARLAMHRISNKDAKAFDSMLSKFVQWHLLAEKELPPDFKKDLPDISGKRWYMQWQSDQKRAALIGEEDWISKEDAEIFRVLMLDLAEMAKEYNSEIDKREAFVKALK